MQPLVRKALFCCALACAAVFAGSAAFAADGTLRYSARVVHHNRGNLSYVTGTVDLASGDFVEDVQRSFALDWRQVPSQVLPTRVSLPSIWQVASQSCQRFNGGLPRYNSPLLRHFLVGQVLGRQDELKKDDAYLSGQLVILTATYSPDSFEIVASFNGAALVVVGRRAQVDGHWLVHDLAVLGPESELYQYFIEDIKWVAGSPAQPIMLPVFDAADYIQFPASGTSTPVPILPVKNWLVFQAQLPGGRPLNLVFDSGADTMIVDDWVLKLDADLLPVGELPVAGVHHMAEMEQYEGFSFEVGGVRFSNLPVVGSQLTELGFGADMRIHGIVGNEILQLCQVELDLDSGQLLLKPLESAEPTEGLKLNLTFINELPHVEAEVQDNAKAYLLVDTGQSSPLAVNLDYLDEKKLGDDLVMDGFTGDITGGLAPRYMLERLGLNLGGQKYTEQIVDATADSTYNYDGVPVVGVIGFPLFARHFAGVTFDYGRAAIYLRGAAEDRKFTGSPEAWHVAALPDGWFNSTAPVQPADAVAAEDASSARNRRPKLLRDNTAATTGSAMYAWAQSVAASGDPLDLVRATPPAVDGEAESRPGEKRTLGKQSLLFMLRETAENVYQTLQQTLNAAPQAVTAESSGAPVAPATDGTSTSDPAGLPAPAQE